MAVKSRPGFEVSVDRTLKSTESKSVFFDMKAGTAYNFRFLPSWTPLGDLFFEAAQHYNFEEEGQKRAWACLRQHGAEGQECPVCAFIEKATEVDAEKYKKQINAYGGHGLSSKWYAQAIPLPTDDKPVEQLYLVGFSKGTAQKVSNILKMERDNRQPLITDPDNGQAVNIARNDKAGKQTRYEVQATGLRVALDAIYPKWTEEFLDVSKAVGLRIVEPERVIASMEETLGVTYIRVMEAK